MKDIRQTPNYAEYMKLQGWEVEKISSKEQLIYAYVKKIPILGAVIKVQRPENLDSQTIKSIEGLRDKYRIFQIIIEPKTEKQARTLTSRGYKLSKSPYLPSKTLHLDLTKSEKNLFNNLKKDCKYSLRKSSDVTLFTDPPIISFHEFWKRAVSWQRYVPSLAKLKALRQTFKNNALFLTSHNGETGAIFLLGDKQALAEGASSAYYWQAFTSKAGRSTLLGYRVLWHGILWAKQRGVKIFDFEGIYDPRFPNKSWRGFTHFKKSFGGYEVTYPGAFVKTRFLKLSF